MKQHKRSFGIFILFSIINLSCLSKVIKNESVKGERGDIFNMHKFTDTEIKYIYHEALRHVLFTERTNRTGGVLLLEEYFKFKEFIDFRHDEFYFQCADKHNNFIFNNYESTKKITPRRYIPTENVVKKIEFNLNANFKKVTIDDSNFKIVSPFLGYFVFSDILVSDNGVYFVGITFAYRLLNTDKIDLYSDRSYILEVKKCKSGHIFFNKIIETPGEKISSDGKYRTITDLSNGYKCID